MNVIYVVKRLVRIITYRITLDKPYKYDICGKGFSQNGGYLSAK